MATKKEYGAMPAAELLKCSLLQAMATSVSVRGKATATEVSRKITESGGPE